MLPRHREDIERRKASGVASRRHIQLGTDAPNDFCSVAFGGKHPAQEK
jgi:hypothetical protein